MSTQEIKILTKILRELSLYFLIHGINDFTLKTQRSKEVTQFIARIKTPEKDEIIEKMRDKISRERELEIETYGWELVGDIDETSELEISSLLLDDIQVKVIGDETEITMRRLNKYRK